MNKVKLGSVTDSCLGKMLDAEKNKGSYQPYLANLNVRWGSFDLNNLSQMRFEEHEQERYGIRAGDLIMCEGGEPGRCAIWRDELPDMKIQKALHRIRPHACLDVHYLYYWFLLAGRLGWLDRHFTETTIKHLPGDKLKDVEIDMPSLAVQKGIADVLSSFDDKITHNASICAELESMAKKLYDYWFVQFDFPDANGKPYRSSGGEMVWNEQLKREIPKGWEAGCLSEVANIVMGQSPDGTSYNEDGMGMVFYQVRTDFCTRFPTPRVYTTAPTRFAKEGDILLSVRAPVGDLNIAMEDCCIGRGLAALNSKLGSQLHLLYTLSGFKQIFDVMDGNGTTFGSITKDTLFEMKVAIPHSELLKAFEEAVSPIEQKIRACEIESRELSELRDWLLPMLMNGQATVAPAESAPKLQVLQPEKPARDPRFDRWLQTQGVAARGTVDEQTLHDIFDAMDDDDKQ